MPIATIQSQIQQLQAQIKLSKSPKQTKMLEGAIARLEKKLKGRGSSSRQGSKLKLRLKPKLKKRLKLKRNERLRPLKRNNQEAIANPTSKQTESGKKKREPMPPKKQQELSDGTILKAVPGQGQHQFYWKVWGEIQANENGDYHLLLEGCDQSIPITLGRKARKTLKDQSLPLTRFCSLSLSIIDGQIDNVQLNACANSEKQAELFVAQGYWIADQETLQIQTNFRFHKLKSRNIFHQIPVREGITVPETGFRSLKLERDRLNVYVVVGDS